MIAESQQLLAALGHRGWARIGPSRRPGVVCLVTAETRNGTVLAGYDVLVKVIRQLEVDDVLRVFRRYGAHGGRIERIALREVRP